MWLWGDQAGRSGRVTSFPLQARSAIRGALLESEIHGLIWAGEKRRLELGFSELHNEETLACTVDTKLSPSSSVHNVQMGTGTDFESASKKASPIT